MPWRVSTVQPGDPKLALPQGPPEFELLKKKIHSEFASDVPDSLRLPQSLISNPPTDVTKVPAECGLLTDRQIEITEHYDALALANAIAMREFTAVEVATAFGKRALIAHQLTCCLTEWFMDEAIARARTLDMHLEETGKTVGPLHGVPISLKDLIPVANHYSTVGYLSTRVFDHKDSHMVAILRKAGAVFYCKTNQPQAAMHLESTSPCFGRTLNPHNIKLSAGGSSGGEAALIAMRGSIMGVGTDIGGSIRGPAAFCGIYGFKATSKTLPTEDFMAGGFAAELNILSSTGPLCTSLQDMNLFVSVLAEAKPYLHDPGLVPIPWTGLETPAKSTPIKVGFMMNDGVIEPQPPVSKALAWAKEQLEKSDKFQVTTFQPFRFREAIRNIRLAYWPDGGKILKNHLAATNEPMLPLTQWIIKDAEGDGLDAGEIIKQRMLRDKFRAEFANHWTSQEVDIVISPAFVGPACSHETGYYWNYTAFWNYVDYPGVSIPTPFKAGKKGTEEYDPDRKTALSVECKHVRQLWAEGDFEGAPVGIQVNARKYHDNQLFGALKAMKESLQLE